MKTNKLTHRLLSAITAALIAVTAVATCIGNADTVSASDAASVTYRTHVQDYGWQSWKSDGQSAGTTGESKRLEGVEIKLSGVDGGISYKTHVQNYGWQGWKSNGQMSGTSGESKRLEAIQIKLTGEAAETYDIYYRVHAQHFGWLDWAKNGEISGTAGYSYRLESLQIKLVAKGGSAPGATTTPYHVALVRYQTHVQNIGWQGLVGEGIMSGTSGKSLRLEGIKIVLANTDYDGSIEYKTHVQNEGWQDWVSDGAMSGTSGKSYRLEGIRIRLTGEMAEHYDIYYRTHVQSVGWQDWVKNGEMSGTSGKSLRLEGIEIELVEKGGAAPASTGASTAKATATTASKKATATPTVKKTEATTTTTSTDSSLASGQYRLCYTYSFIKNCEKYGLNLPDLTDLEQQYGVGYYNVYTGEAVEGYPDSREVHEALWDKLVEFMEDSGFWDEYTDAMRAAGDWEYDFDLPINGTYIASIAGTFAHTIASE